MRRHDIAVIGGGSAGTMAYLRAVLNYDDTAWFTGDADTRRRSRGTWVAAVDNIPGLHGDKRPITGSAASTRAWVEAHEHLSRRSTVVQAQVARIAREPGGGFRLTATAKGRTSEHLARYVIVATGVADVQPVIGGSIEPVFPYANRGDLIYCVRCDGHHVLGKTLAVIGKAQTGVAIANLMHERYGVTGIRVLTHGDTTPATGESAALARRYGVTVHTAPIAALRGEPKGAGLEGFVLEDGTVVPAQRGIVALGIIAHNQLVVQLGGEVAADGRVIVGASGETSVPDLFVVGDLVSGTKMQVYTGWDEAVDAADTINRRLREARRAEVMMPDTWAAQTPLH